MKKKGFTLVELLAVIAILAILVIIALPNVLSMYNEAKVNAFVTEAREHFRSAEQNYLLHAGAGVVYSNKATDATVLEMSGNKKISYYIVFNASGKCTNFVATNGSYKIEANPSSGTTISVEEIGDTYGVTTAENSYQMGTDGTITGN